MSSSPSPCRTPASALAVPADPSGAPPAATPFPYREAVPGPGQHNFARAPTDSTVSEKAAAAPVFRENPEREAQCREQGRVQGAAESRARFEQQLEGERAAIARAVAEFCRERASYYQSIEEEAVRLALNIARRVLHRESQIDPLLLLGMVRVALGKIEGASGVALLVNPQRAVEWRRLLTAHLDPREVPEVVEDPAMAGEQLGLRTTMGTAEIGMESQLKEIENGLMDLLAARPGRER